MEKEFLIATLFNLSVNFIYTLIALFIGIVSLIIIDKKFLTAIDIQEELKKGNIAVAIFASTILLFIALIISLGLKK